MKLDSRKSPKKKLNFASNSLKKSHRTSDGKQTTILELLEISLRKKKN